MGPTPPPSLSDPDTLLDQLSPTSLCALSRTSLLSLSAPTTPSPKLRPSRPLLPLDPPPLPLEPVPPPPRRKLLRKKRKTWRWETSSVEVMMITEQLVQRKLLA